MKQKIFLTSALAMGFVAPAIAEPSHTGEFPADGYMEEDYTYTNAATSTNMDGVYEGSVNAVAEYDIIDYIVNAGQYLPADSETVITCPAGSYCPGIDGNVQYNQTTPQGIQTCPDGFGSSADGSSSNTQCYRTCDINNMGENGSIANIAHATAISGNDYYGNGTDTCEPTDCVNGWHLKSGLDITEIIQNSAWRQGSINNSGVFSENSGSYGAAHYGLTENNTWALEYYHGILSGQGRCSTQVGYKDTVNGTNPNGGYSSSTIYNKPTVAASVTNDVGQEGAQYCYCQINGYKPSSGTLQNLSSSWVMTYYYNDASQCANQCASTCAYYLAEYYTNNGMWNRRDYQIALLGAVTPILGSCEANVININWSDAAQTDIDANNAGTATYGEDVRTPVKAATKKGQRFRGWRFSAPEQTTTGN